LPKSLYLEQQEDFLFTSSQPGYFEPALFPGQFRFEYIDENPIGVGGLGRVDRIIVTDSNWVHAPVGSQWACKRLNAQWSQHPAMRERFEREIAALGRMAHPHIVGCRGQNLPGDERFYVMPLYSSSLRRLIAAGTNRGDWRFVASHGALLADALQYAHTAGFIHRDLKPDNVLFDAGGPLIIADWGLGYFVHKESQVLQQLTRGGMGTEYYCSLEQWGTGKCDGRGDIYSLGMTLDEWVTGRQRVITVGAGLDGPSTRETSPGAQRFNALLRKMTQPLKAKRPATMQAVAIGLRAALDAG
jgi:serine/threonine protein kinase